jgi:hypothetical protein
MYTEKISNFFVNDPHVSFNAGYLQHCLCWQNSALTTDQYRFTAKRRMSQPELFWQRNQSPGFYQDIGGNNGGSGTDLQDGGPLLAGLHPANLQHNQRNFGYWRDFFRSS